LIHAGYAIGVLDEMRPETLNLLEEMAAYADEEPQNAER
jgi:hydrogenase maturation factor